MAERTLSHFACFRLGASYWALPGEERSALFREVAGELGAAAPRVELYQVYPARGEADLLVWSALEAGAPEAAGRFFDAFARAIGRRRPHLEPGATFWGFTRPSPYTGRGGSEREIDAVAGERLPYLVVYPFAKIADWYLRPEGERRELMGEHIRVGREFREVRQLLLYSFGLQDQEFVVVYETTDLARFSELVHELRGTEARKFTALDTPVVVGHHVPDLDDAPWS
ncbi:MAG TPA: chlorite dismutase family protein [Thermoanaerobaculia bacterium]|nr:chlorite dismutase family protein [Thermoanaerobaculia bacterium]